MALICSEDERHLCMLAPIYGLSCDGKIYNEPGVCVSVCIDRLRGSSGTYGPHAILRPCWKASAASVAL